MERNKTVPILGTAAIALTTLVGCGTAEKRERGLITTPYQRQTVSWTTPENLKGSLPGNVDSDQGRYELEKVVLWGEVFYVEKNKFAQENEGSFILRAENESRLSIPSPGTHDAGIARIVSDEVYIQTEAVDARGNNIDWVAFKMNGRHPIQANVHKYDIEGIQTGTIKANEIDVRFDIDMQKIAGTEWYAPHVEAARRSEFEGPNRSILKFYTFDVGTTQLDVQLSNGEVRANNPKIYELRKVSTAEYLQRAPVENPALTNDSPGEASITLNSLEVSQVGN